MANTPITRQQITTILKCWADWERPFEGDAILSVRRPPGMDAAALRAIVEALAVQANVKLRFDYVDRDSLEYQNDSGNGAAAAQKLLGQVGKLLAAPDLSGFRDQVRAIAEKNQQEEQREAALSR